MIIPSYLRHGDRIRIVAPAGRVSKEKVMTGIEQLEESGFEVIVGKYVFSQYFQFAGRDDERAADLQEAIDDIKTKAIICARGGYGSIRIIDKVDFSQFIKNPKWIVGFSDISVLHACVNGMGIASVHGPMPGSYVKADKPTASYQQVLNTLQGDFLSFYPELNDFNRSGVCKGEVVGGNLSLIESLQGTKYQIDTEGKILFLEDLSEHHYHLDRMMNNLFLSGKLEHLAGLIIGGFTKMKDDGSAFGNTAYGIIREAVDLHRYPVCFNFPSGHIKNNLPLVLGANYQLKVQSNACTLNPNKA